MIGTLDVECQAKNPNLPLAPMTAFINSPSSLRIRNVPKRIGDWCIRNVYVTCVYPDGSIQSVQCVLVGGIWVGTIQGTATSGTSKNGYTIFADGTDENGNNVTGYVLGKGDIEILEADGTLSPDLARYYVKLLSAETTEPREGDMYPTNDGYVIWQDGQANLLGTPFEQITAYVDSAISSKADLSAIHGDYIEDADGNKIEADGDITYLDSRNWSVKIGRYDYVLSPSGTDEWTYAEAEGIPGNNKVVLKWVDYMQGWQLSYYQWDLVMAGWNVLSYGETYESPQATSLEIEITGDVSYTAECSKGGPSTGKLAKLSDIDNSHIEDANGNKIYANRTAYYMGDGTSYWVVTYNGNNYQLSGTREYSSYYPENPQAGDMAFSLEYYGYWFFAIYERYDDGNEQWWDQISNFESYDSEDADELYYDDYSTDPPTRVKFAEWTTPQVLVQGELAVKSDLPTKTSDLTNDSGFVNQEQLSVKVSNDGGVAKVRKMTQAQYDALASKDSTTLYVITEN